MSRRCSEEIFSGHCQVSQGRSRGTQGSADSLGAEADTANGRPGGQLRQGHGVRYASDLDLSRTIEEQIGVPIGQDPLDPGLSNVLFPHTGHSVPPARRRWPLPIYVRFVQDTASLARGIIVPTTKTRE